MATWAFIDVPASGIYTLHAGIADSAHNVVMLDGKEVYRREPGSRPLIAKVALETGRRYPVTITYFKAAALVALKPLILDGALMAYAGNPRNQPALKAAAPAKAPAYLDVALDEAAGQPLSITL